MKTYNLALIGFGNVGRCLVRLLLDKRAELRERYLMDWRITGVATRRMGWNADAGGLDAEKLLSGGSLAAAGSKNTCGGPGTVRNWLAAARADVLFELSSMNPETGEPALDHLSAALESGTHAITANKGPVVHGYHRLRELAQKAGKRFFFEATVMGGTPIFSLFRETLPAARLLGFSGLLNSTTSVILHEMEQGRSYDAAVQKAQAMGIAETDPSNDVDGWDAALKLAILANVLMEMPLKPRDIPRRSIREISAEQLRAARAAGKRIRMVARMGRAANGQPLAAVGPEELAPGDPLVAGDPTSGILHFELDTLHGLTVVSHRQGPDTTAYGCFADFINAVKS